MAKIVQKVRNAAHAPSRGPAGGPWKCRLPSVLRVLRLGLIAQICSLFAFACAGKAKTVPVTRPPAVPIIAKAVLVSWESEPAQKSSTTGSTDQVAAGAKLSLALTDETGARRFETVDVEFTGPCVRSRRPVTRADVLFQIYCGDAGSGAEIQIIHRGNQLHVLRAETAQNGLELSFEQVKTVELPPGAAVRIGDQL